MKKRIYSGVLIVLVLALLFVLKIFVSDYFFDILFCALACVGAFEMSRLLAKIGLYNFVWIATGFPVLLLAGNLIGVNMAAKSGSLYWILWTILIDLMFIVFGAIVSFLWCICQKRQVVLHEMNVRQIENISIFKFALKKAVHTMITFVYPAFVFLFFMFINHLNILPFAKLNTISSNVSVFVLITALFIPMLTDTFAMLTGSVIGGKKLCPKISPNKTISGAVGGVLWCVLFNACIYLIFGSIASYSDFVAIFPIWAHLIVVLIGSCIAQCGDLFESIIKRRAGVSDSGKFLPGHGGCLDRIDSHIFMAPYVFLAFLIALV